MKQLLFLSTLFLVACGSPDGGDEIDGINSSDHRIFVTSSSFNGNLGGLSGANSLCNTAARGAGLSLNYSAILSTSSSDAETRLNITGNVFIFTDETTPQLVASSGVALWEANFNSLNSAVNRDELFNIVTANAWTGTGVEGRFIAGNGCDNWTSNSGGEDGFVGDSGRVDEQWVEGLPIACSFTHRLYCISTN